LPDKWNCKTAGKGGASTDDPVAFDGDKSPADSADKSAHSKACDGGSLCCE